MHTGQTFEFAGAPNPVGQPQKIFVRVLSWTCTSNPMTGSYLPISSGVAIAGALEDMLHYKSAHPPCVTASARVAHFERRASVKGIIFQLLLSDCTSLK